ncbi:DUF4276 family protein [Mucilaginibacter sp. L196]|jgi:hypothetical protein|uniref:DUF4276 family protein n=1 Tax=Mucilaginibacter sp. L196 TaxID=1641870 RepID=UPI00131DE95A|nr:DUF4276 family protein [Mucilaginibacter sp. L196]
MSNPAFIVDGFTERNIIQSICPGKPISRTDLNGKNVTLLAMAKKIASLIRLFNNRNYPIIILVDKENRELTTEEMCSQLRQLIINEGINDIELKIGVADRMIENWILADWDKVSTDLPKPDDTDGINGCSKIKEILGSYGKTTDGVDMFLNADPSIIYDNSPSFKEFADQLLDIQCKYLKLAAV